METKLELTKLQTAEGMLGKLSKQVQDLNNDMNGTVQDMLAVSAKLEHVDKRVATASELSAQQQKKKRGGKTTESDGSESTNVDMETVSEEMMVKHNMEIQVLLEEVRSQAQQQANELKLEIDANKFKADSNHEVLATQLSEQVCLCVPICECMQFGRSRDRVSGSS